MLRFIIILCMQLSGFSALADTIVQDDWSGGPGNWGPVTTWDTSFARGYQVSWRAQPGQVNLGGVVRPTPVSTVIAGNANQLDTIAITDINADGFDDVVGADPVYDVLGDRGAVYWWGQQDGQWLGHVIDADFHGAHYVNTVDLDQDGDQDVLIAAYYGESDQLPPQAPGRNGRYAWFENLDGLGTSWQTHLVGELFWGAGSLQAGDIDQDGDLDLVGTAELTEGPYVQQSDLTWFENIDGNGLDWQQHDIDTAYEPYSTLALLQDMDQDGDLDLVTTRWEELAIWWNDLGDGSQWTHQAILVCFGCVPYADLGDIDSDGDTDIGTITRLDTGVLWLENLDGVAGAWALHEFGAIAEPYSLELADMDGDGEIDLLVSSFTSGASSQAVWFQNTGQGQAWQLHTIDTGLDLETWVASGDVNNDGRLDAVVMEKDPTHDNDRQLVWHDLTRFKKVGQITGTILDGGTQPDWSIFDWQATVPENTSLLMQVRTYHEGVLSPFITVPEPGTDLGTLIDPAAQLLQYRAVMISPTQETSPVLEQVSVNR